MQGPHETAIEVRSYELDILGHVNNAVFLNWLEQARLAALEALGFGVQALIEGRWSSNVVRIEIDYRRPARFGDRLRVLTWLERLGNTSLALGHRIEREDEPEAGPVAEARVVVVWLDAEGRPTRVPDEVRSRLAGLEGPEGREGPPDGPPTPPGRAMTETRERSGRGTEGEE